jgi:hypothetical protein
MSNVTQAATIAESMGGGRPTYVAIFITGSVLPSSYTGLSNSYTILQVPSGGGFTAGGGDESKKQWFIRIGGLDESKYLECPGLNATELASSGVACQSVDDFNLTPYAMSDSLFGRLLPFNLTGYIYSTGSGSSASLQFSPSYTDSSNGAPPIETFSYPSAFNYGTNSPGPFKLAYVSPSLTNAMNGNSPCPGNSNLQCFNAILVYQLVP